MAVVRIQTQHRQPEQLLNRRLVRPMSALVRITDLSQTSCPVLKVPTAAISQL
jgi:hypothetical protein